MRDFCAVLFDLDGTLVDSDAAVAGAWAAWSVKRGVDLQVIMKVSPGRPGIETIAELAVGLTSAEVVADSEENLRLEEADLDGVTAMPGAVDLLTSYDDLGVRWGIVTSSPRPLALARIGAARLPQPPVLVTADDIDQGKPDPACYLLGAKLLGVDARHCLVVEDATAGVRSGQAAGMAVAGVRGVAGADLDLASLRDLTTVAGRCAHEHRVDA
ncbi:HAD-IA family hydrolase [Herbidospora mongoliensis]|uniref:HAD-IA family hydrolase n=1 Tax=Herbidospora mongoliensis TaxID=688067 RepID=UPI000AC457BC|nr:HAD-IA family hydrolase [Herbidospora mongoliensis]